MVYNKQVDDPVFLLTFIWSLLGTFILGSGIESDIYCLKSIRESLEDPHGYLNSSWNFNNNTTGFICAFIGVECWTPIENKVLNIRLSDMGLKGQFPWGIENCTSITGLDLSSNELEGPIPFDIEKRLPYVTRLYLSFNNFSGEIPQSIANCSYLNVLKLDHNRLTGHIPQQIANLNRIKVFSVANNLLSGPIPVNDIFPADSYANNTRLCGGPLERCPDDQWKFDNLFKSGFVIGYVVSAVSVAFLFVLYCVPWVHVGKNNKRMTIAAMIVLMIRRKNKRLEVDQVGRFPTEELFQDGRKEISMLEKIVTRMSFVDLSNVTGKFSQQNIIGSGQMGTMYKATLPNGWILAVKRLQDCQEHEEQFVSEIKTLGRLRHDNLLPLLGFCVELNERLLVYKYMSNGNLFDWLHSAEGKKKSFEWPLRVRIAVGLAWLHHGCNFPVVHFNISSKCVLLDRNFEPKVSNFSRALLINPNDINSARGFSEDAEFWEDLIKRDVFHFGIMLLELITRKEPTSSKDFDGSLAKWISDLSISSSSCLYDVIDKSLIGQGFDGEIFQFFIVACNCVQPFQEQRPTMLDLCKTIASIRDRYGFRDDTDSSMQSGIAAPNSQDEHVEAEKIGMR